MGGGLFSLATSNGTRRPSIKLHQWRFKLNVRKKFFADKMIKHWNGCLRRWWNHCSWKCLRKYCNDSQCPGLIDRVVLDCSLDLMISEVFCNVNESVLP